MGRHPQPVAGVNPKPHAVPQRRAGAFECVCMCVLCVWVRVCVRLPGVCGGSLCLCLTLLAVGALCFGGKPACSL